MEDSRLKLEKFTSFRKYGHRHRRDPGEYSRFHLSVRPWHRCTHPHPGEPWLRLRYLPGQRLSKGNGFFE